MKHTSCIFYHSRVVDEIIQLSLQDTYCLSVLLYASPALYLKPKQLSELKVCGKYIYRKKNYFSMQESVKLFICGLGGLDLLHVIMTRRVYFYNLLSVTDNYILSGMFWGLL